jgi:putative addiction module killer protein
MELLHYVTATGKLVFDDWLQSLPDKRTQARIAARLDRLAANHFGDCKPVAMVFLS